jgi:hypothetical protein
LQGKRSSYSGLTDDFLIFCQYGAAIYLVLHLWLWEKGFAKLPLRCLNFEAYSDVTFPYLTFWYSFIVTLHIILLGVGGTIYNTLTLKPFKLGTGS